MLFYKNKIKKKMGGKTHWEKEWYEMEKSTGGEGGLRAGLFGSGRVLTEGWSQPLIGFAAKEVPLHSVAWKNRVPFRSFVWPSQKGGKTRNKDPI